MVICPARKEVAYVHLMLMIPHHMYKASDADSTSFCLSDQVEDDRTRTPASVIEMQARRNLSVASAPLYGQMRAHLIGTTESVTDVGWSTAQ